MKPALIGDTPIPGTSWSMITGPAACTAAVNMARLGPVSCDVETFGLGADSWRLKVVVVSDGKTVAVLDPREPQQHAAIADALDAARQILMWNSCLHGDTLVRTREGYERISALSGTLSEVWDGREWVKAQVKYFGVQTLQKITLAPKGSRSNLTREITATPDHRWLVQRGAPKKRKVEQVVQDLRVGDVVAASYVDVPEHGEEYRAGFEHGMVFGDGCYNGGYADGSLRFQLRLCGSKAQFSNMMASEPSFPPSYNGDPVFSRIKSQKNLKAVPENWESAEYVHGFVAGWLVTDGTANGSTEKRAVCTTNRAAAEWLVAHPAPGGWVVRGRVTRTATTPYSDEPLTTYHVQVALPSEISPRFAGWTVKNIEPLGRAEPVYCATVPTTGLFALAHGILTGNCFDAPILCQNKLLKVDDLHKISDGLIHARLANPDPFVSKALEAVADRLKVHSKGTPIAQTFKELGLSKKDGFHKFDIDRADYLFGSALDGIVTFQLAPLVREEARKRLITNPYQKFRTPDIDALIEREQIVNRVMLRRACLGIRVDFDFAETYRTENASHIAKLESEIKSVGVKPGDGASLLKWLDDEGLIGEDHPRTPTGRLQATAAVLEGMDHPLAQIFVQAKKLVKLDRDYLAKMEDLSKPTGGRIHPQTNIFAAVTGRSSMSNPPLQQIPPAARGIFLPDEGRQFRSIDYSQVEPYVAACIAGDIPVLRGYESGESDLYTDIAAFSSARGNAMPRKTAKVVLLAQMYGEGLGKLTRDLELDPGPLVQREDGTFHHTYDEARALREQIFEVMPATGKMLDNIKNAAKKNRCVPTLSGRVVPVPVYVNKETGEKTDVAGYKGMNYVVQGSSYDLLASAIVRCAKAGLGDAIFLTVHDEIVCDAEAGPDIQRIMEEPNPDLARLAGRTPRVRTEMSEPTDRWQK